MSVLKAVVSSPGGGSGVTSLNGLMGALSLAAGSGIIIDSSGDTITISACGSSIPGLSSVLSASNDGGNQDIVNVNSIALNGSSPITISSSCNPGYVLTDVGGGVFIPQPIPVQGLSQVLCNSNDGGGYAIADVDSITLNNLSAPIIIPGSCNPGYVLTDVGSGIFAPQPVSVSTPGLAQVLCASPDGGDQPITNVASIQLAGSFPITIASGVASCGGYVLTDVGGGVFSPQPACGGGSSGLCNVLSVSEDGGNYFIYNISSLTSNGDVTSLCGVFNNQGQSGITGDYFSFTSISIRGGIVTAIS